jgi:hypothetical protein
MYWNHMIVARKSGIVKPVANGWRARRRPLTAKMKRDACI